ncbi:MAG: putative toxin-antitoxin system toxin component, PIN family [Thermodesulfobacteriota bacterium]|nr:putative toxin-antitoxin system toxin component, PIN family [Thermodesulfobacteriota bacterium]
MEKKAFRVFLDSNVIISGLFSDKGSPRIILDILCLTLPFLTGITGQYNIVEIERNLTKKMPEIFPIYREYFKKLNLEVIPLPSYETVKQFFGHTSEKDAPVLASAVTGNADFLVTGDKKDFSKAREISPFEILSPAEFLNTIVPEIIEFIKKPDAAD